MIENITKIDVARRQLKEAIWLLFYERDTISIHTLVAASHQVLDDLCKHKGIDESIFSIVKSIIRQDKQKYFRGRIRQAGNFFKHADEDPEGMHEFRPALTHFFLFDSIRLLYQLTQSIFPEALVYQVWFNMKYPEILEEGALKDSLFTNLGNDFNPDDFVLMRMVLLATSGSQDIPPPTP